MRVILEQATAPTSRKGEQWQRALDVTAATFGLVLLAPLLLSVAVAILIEDGRPVLFRQERVGRNARLFLLYKFRSMHCGVDQTLHQEHTVRAINGHTALRLTHDPRVTIVGRIIRKWSIDELPNLWNVIRGDMSLVGPRPLVPYESEAIGPAHHQRFSVRPGVTGLAQVSGRLDLTHEERLDLDVAYAKNRNLFMDVIILARTIPCMVRMRG